MSAQPAAALAVSFGFTALSFAALASYDVMAVRAVAPGRIGAGLAALAGVTANACANTLGFAAVTATAVRLRLYGAAGLGVGDVARIAALSSATLVLGFATMLGLSLLVETGLGGSFVHGLGGVIIIAGLAILAGWLWSGARHVRLLQFELALPTGRMALLQMAVGAAEMAAAIGALYVLLPDDVTPPFAAFAAAYVAAVALGLGSQSPGGLGVFEATMVVVLGGAARADILAALLLYRIIYNLTPFALSAIALGIFEMRRVSSKAGSA
jgi:uncharacterized membrane protein YbhN (UPF0104 family)